MADKNLFDLYGAPSSSDASPELEDILQEAKARGGEIPTPSDELTDEIVRQFGAGAPAGENKRTLNALIAEEESLREPESESPFAAFFAEQNEGGKKPGGSLFSRRKKSGGEEEFSFSFDEPVSEAPKKAGFGASFKKFFQQEPDDEPDVTAEAPNTPEVPAEPVSETPKKAGFGASFKKFFQQEPDDEPDGTAEVPGAAEVQPEPASEAPQKAGFGAVLKKFSRSEPDEKPKAAERTPKKSLFDFDAVSDDFNEPEEEPAAPAQAFEFQSEEQAHDVRAHLAALSRQQLIRMILCAAAFVLSLWFTLSQLTAEASWILPGALLKQENPTVYLCLGAVLLLFGCAACSNVFVSTVRGAMKLRLSSDSPAALAACAAVIQTFGMMLSPERIADRSLDIFPTAALLILLLNAVGHWRRLKVIGKNFEFIAPEGERRTLRILPNDRSTREISHNIVGEPCIAAAQRADFLTDFLDHSFSEDTCAYIGGVLSPCLLLGAVATAVGSAIVCSDGAAALTAFSAVCCAAAPLMNLLSGGMILNRTSVRLLENGAMLSGADAMDELYPTNAFAVDAAELFPDGSIILNGIKTFSGGRIDQAILDAAALLNAAGGPLSPVFSHVIEGNADILPTVESLVYEHGMGLSGWVDGRRVLAGNRELLAAHGIVPPSSDYESKYTAGRRKPVYVCNSGELCAMFIVTYRFMPQLRVQLGRLSSSGVGVMVRTSDPNITPELLCRGFHLSKNDVLVLSSGASNEFDNHSVPVEEAPASVATDGSAAAEMDLIASSIRAGFSIRFASVLEVIGMLAGFLLVTFLAFYAALDRMTGPVMLFLELFWCIVGLLPSIIRTSR